MFICLQNQSLLYLSTSSQKIIHLMIFQLWSRFICSNHHFRFHFLAKREREYTVQITFYNDETHAEILSTKTNVVDTSCIFTEVRRKIQRQMCYTREMCWTRIVIQW